MSDRTSHAVASDPVNAAIDRVARLRFVTPVRRRVLPESVRHKMYESIGRIRRRRLYRRFIRSGDLVFDIGANVGTRVETFVKLGANVVAIEPQPACASLLVERFPMATIVQAAVGSASDTATLHTPGPLSLLATLSADYLGVVPASGRVEESWTDAVDVPVITLDALIREHGYPRFVKIDVEGYEPEVLAGLSQPIDALSFEYIEELNHHGRLCIDRLERLGSYRYAYSHRETMVLGPWLDPNTILDWIAATGQSQEQGDIYAVRR